MKLLALVVLVAIALAVVWFHFRDESSASEGAVVERVFDGDTIELVGGERVRLVQIDTPEKGEECYAEQATELTSRLLPPGTAVRVELDPRLDHVDRYGRGLGYVMKDGENVNVTLVRQGAASVWFFGQKRGRYANALLSAAAVARRERRGLWGACPGTVFDPFASVATGPG